MSINSTCGNEVCAHRELESPSLLRQWNGFDERMPLHNATKLTPVAVSVRVAAVLIGATKAP